MKTTTEIYQKLNELTRDAKTLEGIHKREDFEKYVWYSTEDMKKARLNGIRDLRDMIQSDLNKIFKKYTQDFDDLQYNLMGDNDE